MKNMNEKTQELFNNIKNCYLTTDKDKRDVVTSNKILDYFESEY